MDLSVNQSTLSRLDEVCLATAQLPTLHRPHLHPTLPYLDFLKSRPAANSDGKVGPIATTMITVVAESPPVGSIVFFVISLLVISTVVLLLERHYLPLRTTPAYLLV